MLALIMIVNYVLNFAVIGVPAVWLASVQAKTVAIGLVVCDGIGPGRRKGWIDRGYLSSHVPIAAIVSPFVSSSQRGLGRGFWLFDSRWQPNLLRNRSRRFGAVVSAQAMVCVEIIELENRVCRGRPDKSRLDTSLPAMKISAAAKLGLTRTLELTASRVYDLAFT